MVSHDTQTAPISEFASGDFQNQALKGQTEIFRHGEDPAEDEDQLLETRNILPNTVADISKL